MTGLLESIRNMKRNEGTVARLLDDSLENEGCVVVCGRSIIPWQAEGASFPRVEYIDDNVLGLRRYDLIY